MASVSFNLVVVPHSHPKSAFGPSQMRTNAGQSSSFKYPRMNTIKNRSYQNTSPSFVFYMQKSGELNIAPMEETEILRIERRMKTCRFKEEIEALVVVPSLGVDEQAVTGHTLVKKGLNSRGSRCSDAL